MGKLHHWVGEEILGMFRESAANEVDQDVHVGVLDEWLGLAWKWIPTQVGI